MIFESWLMDRIVTMNPAHDSLCGDLLEEFHSGRSRTWLRRQLAYIAVTTIGRRTLAARSESAEAVVVGTAIVAVIAFQGYVALKLGTVVFYLAWTSLFA